MIQVGERKHPEYGFVIKAWRFGTSDTEKPLEQAYNKNGALVGDVDMTECLYKRGIEPELAESDSGCCTIGFCEAETKWYGWSHRAMCSFTTREDAVMFADQVS